ncbi:MAG: cell division protein FtsZ [Candidatus Micrarchaeota archaeon]|nr:cell division protein FtsZ [Candidatus Micrarchaeota archaeon]
MDDLGSDDFVVKLAVVGAGGQGCNLVNRLYTNGLKSATTIALNTDAKHLGIVQAHKKLLIGGPLTRGLGAGGFPEMGAKAAEASKEEIRKAVTGYNLVFIAAGMGGGTGGGSAPIIAEVAREEGALVVAFVTYPFALERSRKKKADWSIEQLSKQADTTVIIENDRLLSYAPNLPIEKAFDLIDSIASNAVRGIADTITLPSLINLDFADVRAIMGGSGLAMINIGYGYGADKVEKAIKSTISHPLLDVDLEGARSAMVHVTGGTALTIQEATSVGEGVTQGLADNANVIFGSRLEPELNDQIRVMSIVTGVKPKFGTASSLLGKQQSTEDSGYIAGLERL